MTSENTSTTAEFSALDRVQAAVNSGDLEATMAAIDRACAPDMIVSTPLKLRVSGAEAQKLVFKTLLAAFPDLHIHTEDRIVAGNKIVYRNVVTGTHQGVYMGVEPTGKKITYNEIFIVRLDGAGRIAQTWGVVDTATQMRQLGLIDGIEH
ncbi:ester cyclase [Catenulispora pinisilvae]|uniref:ester cyclase n=1 Tax=Catenulispora pinisilvae TaxID=2705253 RepID=UPI001891710D|nr:ester cyclase [Catenulispora pinisilvae]